MADPARKQQFIQWLRAVAALEVVVWHSDLTTKGFSTWAIADSNYAPVGGIGVELFFVISGFIMVKTAPRYRSAFSFLRARALRIYPLYWIFTSLAVLAYLFNPAWRQGGAAADPVAVLLSYLILPQSDYPILGPGWTLEHEVVFYLSVALALALFRGLTTVTMVVFGAAVFLLGALGIWIGVGGGAVPLVWTLDLASPYLIAFALGWLLGAVVLREPLQRGAFYLGLLAVLALLALLPTPAPADALLLRIAAAATLFVVACACSRMLEADVVLNRLMWRLGDASYSIYLGHIFILSVLGKMLAAFGPPAEASQALRAFGILASIAFGVACYVAVERPLLRWLAPRPQGHPRSSEPAMGFVMARRGNSRRAGP